MAFRGEVHDRVRFMLGQEAGDAGLIADIGQDKLMSCIPLDRGQVVTVAGIGQLINVDDRFFLPAKPVQYKIRPDESGSAGHKNTHPLRFSPERAPQGSLWCTIRT